MTNGDKAICQEIAREIIKEVIAEHIQMCPHGRSLFRLTCISLGIAIGSGLASGGIVVAAYKLIFT